MTSRDLHKLPLTGSCDMETGASQASAQLPIVTSNTLRQIAAALGIQRANCLHPLSDRYQIEEDAYQCLGASPFKDIVFYCRACGDEVGRVAAHSSVQRGTP